MKLDSKAPSGSISQMWDQHKFEIGQPVKQKEIYRYYRRYRFGGRFGGRNYGRVRL